MEEDHITTYQMNEPPLSPIRRIAIEQDTPQDMNQPRNVETLSQSQTEIEIEIEIPTEIYSEEEGVEIFQGDTIGKKEEQMEQEHQNQNDQSNNTNVVEEDIEENDNKKINRNFMMIVGKYFKSIEDFINLEKTCKEYNGIMEQYHFNPIMFEKDKEYTFFPEIETFHFYGNRWSRKEFDLNRINTLPNNNKIKKIIVHENVSLNAIGTVNNIDFRHIKGILTLGMDKKINLLCGVNNKLNESTIKNIVIPTHITGLDNKCFCFNTFDDRYLSTRIESIFIPTSVISIGSYCFSECYSLTRVDIPTSITLIPICCFNECTSLSSIQLPETIEYIEDSAFNNCLRLSSITIPSRVKELNFKCFFNCVNLSTVKIPSTLKRIRSWCFAMCYDLINLVPDLEDDTLQGIELPLSITNIGRGVFSTCTSISTVNINASIREIDTDCFINCYSLSSIKLPTTLNRIQYSAFKNCNKLTGITLPNSVEYIGYYAFSNCYSLSSITLPSSLKVLEKNCFESCNNLTTLRVPSNLTSINLSDTQLFNYGSSQSYEIKWISPDNDIELTKEKKEPEKKDLV